MLKALLTHAWWVGYNYNYECDYVNGLDASCIKFELESQVHMPASLWIGEWKH